MLQCACLTVLFQVDSRAADDSMLLVVFLLVQRKLCARLSEIDGAHACLACGNQPVIATLILSPDFQTAEPSISD